MYLTGVLVATLFASALAGDPPQPQLQPRGPPGQGPGAPSTGEPNGMIEFPTGPRDTDMAPPLQMSRYCFLGDTPSATCRFRCHLMNMDAYCKEPEDENDRLGEDKCACRPREEKPESAEETESIFLKPQTHKEQERAKAKPGEEGKPHTTTFTIPIHPAPQDSEEDQSKHHVVFYIFDLNKVFGPSQGPETKPEVPRPEEPKPRAAPTGWTVQHYIAILIIVLLLVLITIEIVACVKKQRAKNNDMETIFKNIPMPNKA